LFSASEIQREREIAVVSRDSLSAKNAGFAAGAVLTMVVGFLKHSVDQHRTGKL
jgi:hypothetical protein